jgi:hypothetical protein
MIYVWAGIVIVVLFLVGRIIRWWNLPEVAAARTKRVEERQRQRTERLRIRRERAGDAMASGVQVGKGNQFIHRVIAWRETIARFGGWAKAARHFKMKKHELIRFCLDDLEQIHGTKLDWENTFK